MKTQAKTVRLLLVLVLCGSAVTRAAAELVIERDQNALLVKRGAHPILSYRYGNVPYKPYVDRLFSPAGVNILRDAPHDHLHHHALMYAITVNGVNFWEEQNAPGAQRHRALRDREGTADRQGFTHSLNWVNPRTKEVLLTEERTIQVRELASVHATMVAWESRLAPPSGKKSVTLTGNHYHGLGMRFVVSMDTGGTFFNAAENLGPIFRGTERLGRATWCAYTARAEGALVTVAMFGHPENARGQTLWFTMTKPFAYLSATLNLHREPLTLTAPLALRYAIVLWDGRVEAPAIESLYKRWVQHNSSKN